MREAKIIQNTKKEELGAPQLPVKPLEEMSLKELMIKQLSTNEKQSDKKKIRIPRKAKVRRGKMKKGWIGILRIDENGVISGEKQNIQDSVFTMKGGTYHVTDGREVLFWEGKYPVIVQETKTRNPKMFNEGDNETYGDKYVLAKMLKDAIKVKQNGGNIIIWIILAIVGFFVAQSMLGGA